MTLGALLAETALVRGDGLFLPAESLGHEPVSYLKFDQQVNGLAWALGDLGVAHGDRVATLLPNGVELLYVWFAIARLGAVLVPLNPSLARAEVAALLHHAQPSLVIGPAEFLAICTEAIGAKPAVVVGAGAVGAGAVADAAPFQSLLVPKSQAPDVAVAEADPLTILYTSGTTGRPKGCVLTHGTYTIPAREFQQWLQVTAEDRFLGCLPLFHMAGQSFAASAVAAGASLVLVPRFQASRFWEQVHETKATVFRHLGEMLSILCKQSEHPAERSHSLRVVYGGGARGDIAEAFERRFGVPVVEGYGLTETNTVLGNPLGARRRGSIGRPLSYSVLRLADEHGRELPPGAVGEIQVRRNGVLMKGYFQAPDLTAEALVGEWYRTGDLGYRDDDGYFYFVGRQKEIIRRRGENIVPLEIEEVLNRHPAVAMSAVIPVPDAVGGEESKAFVTLRPGARAACEELVDWCRSCLAEFKVPDHFELCQDLPHTATNKINKSVLRARGTLGGSTYATRPGTGVKS